MGNKHLFLFQICNLLALIHVGKSSKFHVVKSPSGPVAASPWWEAAGAGAGAAPTSDAATTRRNTLQDDADDLQRQLDNEARDRLHQTRPKPLWVFHMPGKANRLTWETERGRRQAPLDEDPTIELKLFGKTKAKGPQANLPSYPNWSYSKPEKWSECYPACGGRSQSPVMVGEGLVPVHSPRVLTFRHYDALPGSMTLRNDGKKLSLSGQWPRDHWPSVWGGAAQSRRYIFSSLELHWPSEHRVGYEQFPLELQAIHVAAEYSSLDLALSAGDPEALLIISYLFQYGEVTKPSGVGVLLATAIAANTPKPRPNTTTTTTTTTTEEPAYNPNGNDPAKGDDNSTLKTTTPKVYDIFKYIVGKKKHKRRDDDCPSEVMPLKSLMTNFSGEYATYSGSLASPPCTEAVRWIIYSRPLSVRRDVMEAVRQLHSEEGKMKANCRPPQPLNDRRLYYFS